MRRRPASPGSDEGLRIQLAGARRVRCIVLGRWHIALIGAASLLLAGWLIATTAYVVFHQQIREASHFYLIEKQRAYEDRIAGLRRQIDEINGRQFLDQVAFENKLAAVRERQRSLEERHTQLAGFLETLEERDVSLPALPVVGERKQASAGDANLVTGSVSPTLVGRPRPDAQSHPMAARADSSPAGLALTELEAAVERLHATQDRVLLGLEAGLVQTIEQLSAVPEAIDAPLPDLEGGSGIGGPFVELRGADQPVAIEDQIARIEQALDRVEALGRHVRRLPVRHPLAGGTRITSRFGSRVDPFLGRRAMHTGIDFRAGTGTPVMTTAAGRVTKAGRLGGYGNLVEIDHGDGYSTRYAHLSRIDVRRGQTVAPGDVIGAAGSTGRSTGPHLHYETRIRGRAVDPAPFVEAADLLPDGF